jgi:hypothetical protein
LSVSDSLDNLQGFANARLHANEGEGPGAPVSNVPQSGKQLTEEQLSYFQEFLHSNSKHCPNIAVKEKIPETETERYQRRRAGRKKEKKIVPCRWITAPNWSALFSRYHNSTSNQPHLRGEIDMKIAVGNKTSF